MSQKLNALKVAALCTLTLFNINAKGEYFENPNYHPCMAEQGAIWDRAIREIGIGESELTNLNNNIKSAREGSDPWRKTLAAEAETRVKNLMSKSRNEILLESEKSDEEKINRIYNPFKKISPKFESSTPELILSLRNFLILKDSLINLEISNILEKIKNEKDELKKVSLEFNLDRLLSIKTFKESVKDDLSAVTIFQNFMNGTDQKALDYINRKHWDLFDKAKNVYLNHLIGAENYQIGMAEVIKQKVTIELRIEIINSYINLQKQKDAESLRAIKNAEDKIAEYNKAISGFESEIQTVNQKLDRFRAERDASNREVNGGCRSRYPGRNVPTPREPRER